ncbi:MAG: hypothetical protein QOE62_1448 [Actinomycetota bacterium]|nr:hypothetical protein [Actinomycetota bacterium]
MVDEDQADDVSPESAAGEHAPHALILLGLFLAIAIGLTFPNVSRLRTYVAGDSGDSLLNLWIIRRIEIGLPHGWNALWNPPIFFPARNVLAYSDTMLPVALVHWVLRPFLGDVLALNVIYLGAWVLSSWCVYRLAMRFVRHWGAAFAAALTYTYSVARLIHHQHFQLVVGGALVPLVLLLLLRLFDRPSPSRAAALGLGVVALTLTASYFGALMGLVLVVVAGGLLLSRRPGTRRPYLRALTTAAAIAVVLIAPFSLKYVQLQRQPEFRRHFVAANAVHAADFLATAPHNYVLDHLPVIPRDSRPESRGIENRLFPGLVTIAFAGLGVVLVGLGLRRRAKRPRRVVELLLVTLAAVFGTVLSLGDWTRFDGHRIYLPFTLFRRFVPGFAGMRAVSRLELALQLALALLAAVGIDAVLGRIRSGSRSIVAIGLAALVVAECAIALVFVRVPTSADDGGVDTALRTRPAGVVLELPISSAKSGLPWVYAEAPRQLVALRDHDPRVNGYSGFQPKGFDTEAAVLNHFPAPDALALAHQLGVRYVVLRTKLVGDVSPATAIPAVDRNGAGRYDEQTAADLVAAVPPGAAAPPVRLAGGYLVELTK